MFTKTEVLKSTYPTRSCANPSKSCDTERINNITILYHWLAVVKSLCEGKERKPLSFLLE